MKAPEWLHKRNCDLKLGSDHKTWYVLLAGKPQYALVTVPAGGKHGCAIRETINGKRIASKATYASAEDALRGGLEDLRSFLGWA